MRRLILITILAAAALTVAGPAAATRYIDTAFVGDCTSWHADLLVRLHYHLDAADVAYAVAIEDMEGNVLLDVTGTATILDEDGDHYGTVSLGGAWNDATDEIIPLYGAFVVRGTFTLQESDGYTVSEPVFSEATTVECAVVPDARLTWGTLKSEYR